MPYSKRRVLLVCPPHLFGESLETILRRDGNLELLGPLDPSQADVESQLREWHPDAVVIVDQGAADMNVSHLIAAILQQFPTLPVIRAGLEHNVFRVFSAHTLPARSSDLVEAILSLPPARAREATQSGSHSESRNG